MKRKTLLVGLLVIAVVIAAVVGGTYAATEDEIEEAIAAGVAWLTEDDVQNPDGSWGDWDQTARTCFVLVKLEERAYDLDYESPFDPDYPYSDNVIRGWQYIFGGPHTSTSRFRWGYRHTMVTPMTQIPMATDTGCTLTSGPGHIAPASA